MLKVVAVFLVIGNVLGSSLPKDIVIASAPYFITVELDNNAITDGALVAPNWVVVLGRGITWLTDDDWQNHVQVRAGSDRRSADGQTRKPKNHTFHELFDANSYDYNVAVIELENGFDIGENIQVANLGNNPPSAGSVVDVSEYGSLPDQGQTPDRLQQFNVTVIARIPCAIAYQDYLDEITDRNLCGGMPEGDVCYGESGAPVTQNGTLVALYASSLGCHNDMPAIFTNLVHPTIKRFILENISNTRRH